MLQTTANPYQLTSALTWNDAGNSFPRSGKRVSLELDCCQITLQFMKARVPEI